MLNQDASRQGASNRAYTEMLKPAVEWLSRHSPDDIEMKAGVTFDKKASCFTFESLGQTVRINYPDYDSESTLSSWHHLLVLHYLNIADGTPLSPDLISFGTLPDGMIRGGGFDRDSEKMIGGFFGDKPRENIEKACAALGATFADSNADLCAVIPFLPRCPLTFKLWLADDEFPASGRLLLNASAQHYLTVEDAVTAGGLVLDALMQAYIRLYPEDA